MKRILLMSFVLSLFLCTGLMAQERTVTGKVTSANDGSGLPGVNVILKGTTTGTVTDIDGNYKISITGDDAVLVYSFIGLITQEVTVGSRSTIDVQMADDVTQLSEVVVTALGIEREARSIGYGIDQVKGEELVKSRETNIVNALQGKVTGVNVVSAGGNLGSSSKIVIRGITSLNGQNDPLWVVDGVPINNRQNQTGDANRITGVRDFANGAAVINPDDVESINVLKGAAATALYGSRAAAGAIIVTTKKGKTPGGKPQVSINSTVRFDNVLVTPDFQGDYVMGDLYKYDSSSIGFDWGPRNVGQTVSYTPVTGEVGPLVRTEDNGFNDFYETGVTLLNNVSLQQGDDVSDYRLSLTSLNQTGVLPASELDRYTISLNAGKKHTDWIRSRFNIQLIRTESVGTGAAGANDPNVVGTGFSFSSNLDQNLFKPWIDGAGNQINNPNPTTNNPYWIRNENANERLDNRILSSFEVVVTPIDKLNITSRVGYDYDSDQRFLSNRKGTITRLEGDFTVDDITRTQFNFDAIATYQTDINEDLNLLALAGWQYNRRKFKRETLLANQLVVAEVFNPANASQTVPSRDFADQTLLGLYGSIELDYKNWLTLTVTARNDWSSTLPESERSYFYPSVSAAWVFTDALGISNNILSYGKLRASWAQVGNDTNPYLLNFNFIPDNDASGQYGLDVNFPFNGAAALRASTRIPPQQLLPEEQTTIEVGAELGFLDGKIGLDFAYFNSENKNQIVANLPVPESTGFASLTTNAGTITTNGIELAIDATPVSVGDFQWNTTVNFTHSEATVDELADGVDRFIVFSAFNSVQVVAVPGKEYQLFAVPWLRDSTSGRPIINADNGLRQAGQPTTFGSVFPDFTMGFVNNLSWKGFNLSFTIDWRNGGVMKSSTVEALINNGTAIETLRNREGTFVDLEGVLDNGDGTFRDNDIPVRSARDFWVTLNDNSVAEPGIFDASYAKLREVAITYNFPSSMFENSFIKSLSVGVEGRNVALLYSEVPHIDPEAALLGGSGDESFGIERAGIPPTRSIGFNLRLGL